MTQQLLFFLVITIGAFYAKKNIKKAKNDIEKFEASKKDKQHTDR